MIADRTHLFVVGAPRSGTTWLHSMLADHPAVASLKVELTLFSHYLAPGAARFEEESLRSEQGHWHQGLPQLFTQAEFDEGLRTAAEAVYQRVLGTNPESTHILDKHPGYSRHIPLIARLMPKSRFIHIIRDGREVAVSMMSAKRRLGYGAGEIQGAAREWHGNICHARSAGVTLGPARYMEVRYEYLVEHTATALGEVFEFSGLKVQKDETERIANENNISRKQVSRGDVQLNTLRAIPDAIWKAKLSLEERWIMEQMVGHLLKELGYARSSDWWALHSGDKLRMAGYPLFRKLGNTIGSTLHTWRKPLVKRIDP
ncbi:MAG: sulfotransferase [Flavobacteriales bacterium]